MHLDVSWRNSAPCTAPYTFIGKMETRNQDLAFLDGELNLGFSNISLQKQVTLKLSNLYNFKDINAVASHDSIK